MDWRESGAPGAAPESAGGGATGEQPPADGHHPSWASDQRRFFAALGELGIEYDALKGFCASKNMPKPSAMDQGARERLVKRLREDAGRAAFDAWLASQASDSQAAK
jgi:hypothetical protein